MSDPEFDKSEYFASTLLIDKSTSKKISNMKGGNTNIVTGKLETTHIDPFTSTQDSGGNNNGSSKEGHDAESSTRKDIEQKVKDQLVLIPKVGELSTVTTFMGPISKLIKVSIPSSCVLQKVNKKTKSKRVTKPIFRKITTRSLSKKLKLEESTKKAL